MGSHSNSFSCYPSIHEPYNTFAHLQPQGVTPLWLVLIAPTHERMARLSLPGWLVTYRDKCSALGTEPGHGHPSEY